MNTLSIHYRAPNARRTRRSTVPSALAAAALLGFSVAPSPVDAAPLSATKAATEAVTEAATATAAPAPSNAAGKNAETTHAAARTISHSTGHTAAAFRLAAGPDIERALKLEAQAMAYLDKPDKNGAMASLLERAAEYREDADPHKVENLRNASRLHYYAGNLRRAENAAQRAAGLALRQGDVVEASHAYLDAALLASEQGNAERAHKWVDEVRMLAQSPLLDAESRAQIESRMQDAA